MRLLISVVLIALLSACSNDDGGSSSTPLPPVVIDRPIADAGNDVTLQQGATVVLNGSASYDPEGAKLSYQWSVVAKPSSSSSELSDPTSPFPSIYLDAVGDYTFELIVNNGEADSLPATVTISDSDATPVANAGPDIGLTLNTQVTLDGSRSYDSDGDAISYAWTLVQTPSGSAATLSRADTAFPVFTPDVSGDYSVELVVSDGQKTSDPDTVNLSTNNVAPISNAGSDQSYTVGASVSLDGSKSSDTDGDTLSYQWHIVSAPAGSTAALQDADQIVSSLTPDVSGDYVVALIVNDGTVDSSASTVTLRDSGHRPIASAGLDQSVVLGQVVHLDGSLSSDLDGDSLTASWSMVSKPKNSAASLTDVHTMHPQFTPDADGDYVVALTVFDGSQTSAVDTVVLSTNNLAPVAHAGSSMSLSVGTVSHLNGSQSSDPEGQPLSYSWSILSAPAGSAATLSDASVVAPDFTADVAGTYQFQLIVNDGLLDSSPSTVLLTEVDLKPVANAGLDQTAQSNVLVSLDGTGSNDPEGQPLSFAWSFVSVPTNSSAQLTNADQALASFTPDIAGDYVVQLKVTDSSGQTSVDTVVIRDSSRNTMPVANAGGDLQVDLGKEILLDGSKSSDADGDMLTYRWAMLSRPSGSSAQLTAANTSNPRFTPDVEGDFVIQLVVSDGQSVSLPDVVMIHDTKRNLAPTALVSASGNGTTGQAYTLSGQASSDPNGDALSYRWAFLVKPSGSSATLSDPTAVSPTFTPDVAGDYTLSLVVSDSSLNSTPATVTVTINDPAKGAAIVLPSGHNLLMLSVSGGDSGSGSLVSMPERDLSKATELFSFHGAPGFSLLGDGQSLVAIESEGLLYGMITESGIYGAGTIITYNPATKELKTLAHVPHFEVNGYSLGDLRSKLLFHPDGKSIYTYSRRGGTNDAGLLVHINNDSQSADYRKVSVIGEFGVQANGWPGTGASPATDLRWNGNNRLIALYGRSITHAALPAVEFTPSDSNDLSKPWDIGTYGQDPWSRTRSFLVENDELLVITFTDPPGVNAVTRTGGGAGFTVRDCRNPAAVFSWQAPRVFALCNKSSSGSTPVLLETNMAAVNPGVVHSFSNWGEVEVSGVTTSTSNGTLYVSYDWEGASAFVDFDEKALQNAGLTRIPSNVVEVSSFGYNNSSLIKGSDELGTIFLGDPAVLNDPQSGVNDQYISVFSYNGGDYDAGAILTHDRVTAKVTSESLGFEIGGYPFGRVLKLTSGDFMISALESRSNRGGGSPIVYDSATGSLTEIPLPQSVRPGLSHVQASNGNLYSIGMDLRNRSYLVYELNGVDYSTRTLGTLAKASIQVPEFEASIDSGNLWALDDGALYCFDLTQSVKNSFNLANAGLQQPVRGIVFPVDGGDGFVATRESNVAGQGTIQRISNQCSAISLTASVSGLTDLPSTALLAASDGFMYYGTDGGKLMKYDESLNAVTEVAAFANTSVVGFLTEDSNGDIVGVLSDGDVANDQIFAYTLATSATVTQAVPADTPVDTHYPGLVEIN